MQRLIVNCQTGQTEVIELTPEEETDRLQEIELGKQRELIEQRRAIKQQLIRVLTELREMRQNRDVFTDEDIAEKQAEVDGLKGRI